MDTPRILIIEDEPKVANFIKKGLEENNYIAEIAYDGQIGRNKAINEEFNLILLDLNLPIINGFELCNEIRKVNQKIPILMLTALGTVEEKLKGFDVGADDYLLKPFEFKELLARIKALLKRSENFHSTGNVLAVADIQMDTDKKIVKRNNNEINLTAKEFSLLEYLIRNKGRVISRAEIAENIWDITFDTGTNVIDVYINFLRKKIDTDSHVKLIHTKVGMGYMLKESD
jgi:two-component system, OmpR family, copper resistance phosphate regulon response regulator CusR